MIGRYTKLVNIEFFIKEETREHKRVIYGPLELLGDVGGLADALIGIGSALITALQFLSGN